MKKLSKALLSLLCAVTLLVGVIPAVPVAAEMGCDFPWTAGQTLLEQIIERDGLLDGIWFPWINGGQIAHNLTGNDVMAKYVGKEWARVEMDYYGADKIYREIYNLKAMGFNMMAWGGSAYGEGVIFDDYGDVIGIKKEYLDNARRLLDMCREIGMPVMWNIYFHSSSAPHYYGVNVWNIMARMLGDRTVADHYAERFVKPLCQMLAEYPDVVALVSIADEPENEINDSSDGAHFGDEIRCMYGVNRDDMIYFMKGINDTVREVLPNMPRTVASNSINKLSYADFELDLMGHNRYDTNANVNEVKEFLTDGDIILTEYNIGGDAHTITDQEFADQLMKFRQNFMDKGYKGGFQWCWMPKGTDAAYYLLNSQSSTDFKETVALTRYNIDAYRAEYRGETITFDKPVMYANDGTGLVEWIPSRNATKLTIERSDDDGKTWKKILDNADAAQYITKGKGVYKDTDGSKPKSGYYYRVTMSDGKNTATSDPNNKAGSDKAYKQTYKAPSVSVSGIDKVSAVFGSGEKHRARLTSWAVVANRPKSDTANLIKNGSFESTSGAQWNASTFLTNAKVVSDSTAPEGDKSLLFDTSGKGEGWYFFEVTGLQPETAYTVSAWMKGDYLGEDNAGRASFGVYDPDLDGFMVYWEFYRGNARSSRLDQQLYPTAWDNEWHLRAVNFETKPGETSVTIALYGNDSKMWLDGIALYNADDGKQYLGANASSNLRYTLYHNVSTCEPSKSVTENIRFDDASSDFWQTGDGWRNGFLSIKNNPNGEYGSSLKYTPTDAVGNYYVKWIDVEPNTYYVFSGCIKVTKQGNGGLALIEDNHKKPTAKFYLRMDKENYGSEWFRFSVRVSTSNYDRVGIAFCDLGGEGWIDNLRFFKVSDAKEVTDTYTDKDGNPIAPPNVTVEPEEPTTNATEDTTTTTIPTLPSEMDPDYGVTTTTQIEGEQTTSTGTVTTTATTKKAKTEGVLLSAVTLKGDYKVLGIILYVALAAVIATVVLTIVVLARKKKAGAAPETPAEDTPDTPETPAE